MRRRSPRLDMEALIRDHKGGRLKEPPRHVLARAIALRADLHPRPRTIAAWVASLVFDSALMAAPTGVRRGPATGERRFLYELREGRGEAVAQLDVRIREERGGAFEVLGQLLPPVPGAGVEIRVARGRRKVALGPNGEFRISGVSARATRLTIEVRAGDRPIARIEDVPLPDHEGGLA